MTWEEQYAVAESYCKVHGNLLVPYGTTVDGFNLYGWLAMQRYRYRHVNKKGVEAAKEEPAAQEKKRNKMKPLTEEQIEKLEAIGMQWQRARNTYEQGWEIGFSHARKYYEEHGNLQVPPGETEDGFQLSRWIIDQRRRYRISRNEMDFDPQLKPLTEVQIQRLESIGMIWDPYEYNWERSFAVAKAYYEEHGNLIVPKHYVQDGIKLSHWIWRQRQIRAGTSNAVRLLTEEQIQRLDAIGMEWAPKAKGFSYHYALAKKYYDAYGNTDFPGGDLYVDGEPLPESGEALRAWKQTQEERLANISDRESLNHERRTQLHRIGIHETGWKDPWEKKFQAAEAYYREHGNLQVPFSYQTEDGQSLGQWICHQRSKKRGTESISGKLSENQIQRLESIGMVWEPRERNMQERQTAVPKRRTGIRR